jgi:hypothetical protein
VEGVSWLFEYELLGGAGIHSLWLAYELRVYRGISQYSREYIPWNMAFVVQVDAGFCFSLQAMTNP